MIYHMKIPPNFDQAFIGISIEIQVCLNTDFMTMDSNSTFKELFPDQNAFEKLLDNTLRQKLTIFLIETSSEQSRISPLLFEVQSPQISSDNLCIKAIHQNGFFYFVGSCQPNLLNLEIPSKARESLFSRVIDSASDISIIATNTEGLITLFNKGAEKLLGYSADEMALKQTLDLIHDLDEIYAREIELSEIYQKKITDFDTFIYTARKNLGSERRKWTYVHKSGRRIPVSLTISCILDENEEIIGYLGVAVDISEEEATSKWNEDLLNELVRFKEGLDESALVAMTDPQGRINFVNKKFMAVSGYNYDELFFKSHSVMKSNRHSKSYYKRLWNTINAGEIWQGEFCNITKSGDEFWVNTVIIPFKDINRITTHFLSISHDITKEKKATIKAVEASKAKTDFLSNMSHEIRTPMNGVIGMTNLLLETDLSDNQLDLTKTVKDCADSLLEIINDILDFSKIQASKLRIESTSFDLFKLCQNVIKIIEYKAEELDLDVQFDWARSIQTNVKGDPTRLRQVLINLLGNAIKFTPKGVITLKVFQLPNKNIRFEVIDTGIGIAPEVQAKLFDKFTQAEASTTRKFGGTGLGLSISKQLVELMGGEIGIISKLDCGSKFWFELLMPEGDLQSKDDSGANADSEINWAALRLLVVEDNMINQKVLESTLKKFHIIPVFAENGQIAIQKLLMGDFDLILMDMQMPVMDGATATREIRSNPIWDQLPIIAMTANVMDGFKDFCLSIGMNDFVSKPYTRDKIKKCIQLWFDNKPI